jgi:methyl-accepting chemotaxis protein
MDEKRTLNLKRRQYFINRQFQTRFILKFIAVLLFGAILSTIITMVSTQETLTSTFDGSRLVIEKTSLAILPSVILTNIITTVVIGIIALVLTLVVSHRIAGPMYRFEKDLGEIARGNLNKQIHIRNGDQFASVAENLNEMVSSLNRRLSEVRNQLQEISEDAAARNVPQSFLEDLEKCRRSIDSKFKL